VGTPFPDDTALDAIAAQVRALAPLADEDAAVLMAESRQSPSGQATARLVEQQLGTVLAAVLARRSPGLDVMDLYQEGSIAATVAVGEYVGRGGPPEGLRPYVKRVVEQFLDDVIERETAQRVADALLVEKVKLLEAAELALRDRLEREPTTLELAAALNWTPEAVEVVAASLSLAREQYDAEIVEYLDDIDGDTGDGTADV
jgi:DNA-directed RNA polymerase sigma subunit (sigma70/sigma32)